MTYKEIINRIRTVAQDHLMIKDFGYGELSDIKTQSQFGPDGLINDNQEADYPYMFLLQSNAVRNDPVVNYNFSMIMMDMARGEEGDTYDNYLTIQSQCQQYIDDVLANLYYFYRDQPMVQLTGITYTPFKEKYQDEVAGMTCNFNIEVPNGLNDCLAPFDEFEHWTQPQQYMGGTQDGAGNPPPYDRSNANQYLIINNKVQGGGTNNWLPASQPFGSPATGGTFIAEKTYSKISLTFDMTYTWDPVPYAGQLPAFFWYYPEEQPQPLPVCQFQDSITITNNFSSAQSKYPDVVTGWPNPDIVTPIVGTTYPVTMEWNNITVEAQDVIRLGRFVYYVNGDPGCGLTNVAQFNMANLNLKLFV